MICNTIGLTADSFESIYTTGGTEVEEVYGAIDYAQPIYAKIREITGTSPLTFTSRVAGTLTDYLISGETIQNGTPSPDMPVEVQGVGERTENLLDTYSSEINNFNALRSNGLEEEDDFFCTTGYIQIKPNTYYTINITNQGRGDRCCCFYDENKNFISSFNVSFPMDKYTALSPENAFYIRCSILSITRFPDNKDRYMLTEGENIPQSYIPYGYKLPVTTTNGTDTVTTPIYIGAEPLHRIGEYADYVDYSTGKIVRRIKKFVFDGTEGAWIIWGNKIAYRVQPPSGYLPKYEAFCTHFVNGPRNSDGRFGFDDFINFRNGCQTTTSNAFNEYLAAQYAAGTPVTVWYVLATPIEEDPPVPFPSIPTLSGINIMSVDTTVKPSQMYIKGRIKPDGYGKLVDKNGVYILDKDGVQLTVHGQGTSNA